mgnify:CR=1 FL=1
MIIQPEDKTLIEIYECGLCHGVYLRSDDGMSCAVHHPPNSCCHFGETEIDDKGYNSLVSVLDSLENR